MSVEAVNSTVSLDDAAQRLASLANDGRRLLILSHRNPDGDTLGCAFALKIMYEALGGTAQCACSNEAAPYLRFIYFGQETLAIADSSAFDSIIAVDVAAPSQLGELERLRGKVSLMLDHHGKGEIFAPDFYVDPTAAAAGEIVYRIYMILRGEKLIPSLPEAAMRIFASLSADTGSFRFSNTTPQTLRIAAELISELSAAGIEHAEISRRLHEVRTVKDLTAERLAIDKLSFACGGSLAYVFITADEMRENSLGEENTGTLVDIPRSVEGVLAGIAIKQSLSDARCFRISARSNCGFDVAAVCASFGGGGHKKAAGGSVYADSAAAAQEIIVSAFCAALEEFLRTEKQGER